jgi:hypothetical protein
MFRGCQTLVGATRILLELCTELSVRPCAKFLDYPCHYLSLPRRHRGTAASLDRSQNAQLQRRPGMLRLEQNRVCVRLFNTVNDSADCDRALLARITRNV